MNQSGGTYEVNIREKQVIYALFYLIINFKF